jgi:hypothetical protein
MKRYSWLLVIMTAVVFGYSSNTFAAEKLSGKYYPPTVDSRFEYDEFKVEIFSNSNHLTGYNSTYNGKTVARYLTSLFVGKADETAKIEDEKQKHSKLWPLKVGNYIEFEVSKINGIWLISAKVIGTETIKVGNEDIFTFVIELDEEATTHTYGHIKKIWYSPLLGANIKSFTKITKGSRYGQTRSYELRSYSVPNLEARRSHLALVEDRQNGVESSSAKARLQKLKKLFEAELITEDEYNEKKNDILSKM